MLRDGLRLVARPGGVGDSYIVGRWVNVEDLVTAAMIEQRTGALTTTVLTWRRRYPDMPQPVTWLGAQEQTPVWLWSELAPWLQASGVLSKRHTVPMTGDPADDLLSGKDVAELLGWKSPGTPWQQHQVGTFPAPVRAERPRMWRRADVEEWARTHPRRPSRRQNPGAVPPVRP